MAIFIPALLLFLAVPIVWLYAEFKLGRRSRITFGLLSMICIVFLTNGFWESTVSYERAWHRNSIRDADSLLKQGQTNVVISAFDTYNSIMATSSTFRASEQMMHILRKAQNAQTN
jgi:high-affinity Fe2+/Pb2+ permease